MCPYPGTLLMILFALLPKSKQLSQSREWGGHKNHLEKGKDNYSLSNLKTQTIPVISCFSGSPERLRRYPSNLYISHILMTPPPSSTGSFAPSWECITPALCRHRSHYLMCFSKLWLWSNRLIQNGTQDKLSSFQTANLIPNRIHLLEPLSGLFLNDTSKISPVLTVIPCFIPKIAHF